MKKLKLVATLIWCSLSFGVAYGQYGTIRPGDKMEFEPAVFETITETYQKKPKYKTYSVDNATYEWVKDSIRVVSKPEQRVKIVEPPVFDTIYENVRVKDAEIVQNGNCSTCTDEKPPQTQTIEKVVLVSPAYIREETIPAQYKYVEYWRQAVKTPEKVNSVDVNGVTGTITKYNKKANARFLLKPSDCNDCKD